MSKVEDALQHAADQWRDEVDAAYTGVARRAPRPPRRRRSFMWAGLGTAAAVAVAAVVWATSSGGGGGQHPRTQADCAGPVLRVPGARQPLSVRPGQRLTVRGRYYVTGCQDSVGGAPPAPIGSVRLTLAEAGGRRVVLARAHPAGELGTFRVRVRIPRDAPAGRATLRDGGISTARVKLVVSP